MLHTEDRIRKFAVEAGLLKLVAETFCPTADKKHNRYRWWIRDELFYVVSGAECLRFHMETGEQGGSGCLMM